MRISIWQQFSSNHSGGFTVVGVFVSEEEAQAAEYELHEILRAIADAREYEHTERDGALTWPEVDYSQRLAIPWSNYSIDWIVVDRSSGTGVLNVTRLDRHVFVTNLDIDNTKLGHKPVDGLVKQLGGTPLISESFGEYAANSIVFEVSCEAPDDRIANEIFGEIDPYLAKLRAEHDFSPAPWEQAVTLTPRYHSDIGNTYYGHIAKSGTLLRFRNLTFGFEVGYAFPALLAYLKAKGCTNIQYTVNSDDMDKVYESS